MRRIGTEGPAARIKSGDGVGATKARRRWWAEAWASPVVIAVFAFVVRMSLILVGRYYEFPAADDHWEFGWEMGRLARSIATGEGYSSPFLRGHTGPTAWQAPAYPYLAAGVFKLFGVYSEVSAFVLLTANAILAALTCALVYRIGAYSFDSATAVIAASIWAFFPLAVWPSRWVWETSLSACLLTLGFLMTLRMSGGSRPRDAAALGFLWGIAALTNPALLAFLPVSVSWLFVKGPRGGARWLKLGAVMALVFCATVAPWAVRNQLVLGSSVVLRSNFGAQLRLGNASYADGLWLILEEVTYNEKEFQRFRELGEVEYSAERGREAVAFIREHPLHFLKLVARRVLYFWTGTPEASRPKAALARNVLSALFSALAMAGLFLAMRRKEQVAWLFLGLLVLYPAVYYVTFAMLRYRHPIEPEMAILCAYILRSHSR